MNKKIIILITIAIVIIGLGIGFWFIKFNNNSNNNLNENPNNPKIAILYFSATGVTKNVSEYIKNTTNGELIEIIPKEKYTDDDLNYTKNDSRANKEQNDSSARPEISNEINLDNYDIIFLGYPIWWGDVPKIILTFLDSYDLKDKTLIPFCTSSSSNISNSLNTLKNYKKEINWIDGKRFSTNTNQNEIDNWVNELNLH